MPDSGRSQNTKTVIQAFISSRLDYRNSMFYGTTDLQFWQQQSVQNATARLVTGTWQLLFNNIYHLLYILCTHLPGMHYALVSVTFSKVMKLSISSKQGFQTERHAEIEACSLQEGEAYHLRHGHWKILSVLHTTLNVQLNAAMQIEHNIEKSHKNK